MSETGKTRPVSRRNFAVAIAGAGAAAPLLAQQAVTQAPAQAPPPQRRFGPPPEEPPFDAPLEFARKDVTRKVMPFPMQQVKLLPGMYTEVAEWNRGYMNRLTTDRLLYNFRRMPACR